MQRGRLENGNQHGELSRKKTKKKNAMPKSYEDSNVPKLLFRDLN
jgi:hypothetical protein